MKVLVTGGCGFIGSHVVEKFVSYGYEVIVVDNLSTGRLDNLKGFEDKVVFCNADISKPGSWQDYFSGAGWVVHLAALADIVPSIQMPEAYFKANVDGTFNVVQAAVQHKVKRFVYSASSSCYGIPDQYPTPESAPIKPQYPYALTKRLGEELVLHWHQVYGLPANSLRFFNVYGPRSRTSGTYGAVFGVFLAQKLAGKPFTVVGDGKQTRDFTYVSDIVDAVEASLRSDVSGEVFNVGSKRTVSVLELTSLLGGEITFIPRRPGEPDSTFADTTKIEKTLSWKPKVPIDVGVERILENIDYWRAAPVWDPQSIALATRDWFQLLGK